MCLYFQIQNLQMNVIASASIEIKLKNIEESVKNSSFFNLLQLDERFKLKNIE